jgi:hypothetical protein
MNNVSSQKHHKDTVRDLKLYSDTNSLSLSVKKDEYLSFGFRGTDPTEQDEPASLRSEAGNAKQRAIRMALSPNTFSNLG